MYHVCIGMWFIVIKFGGGGGSWSQIKPITFGNELRTYDMIPKAQLGIEGIVFGVVHLSDGHLSHTIAVELLADKQETGQF